jgi:hypothetical protein
MISFCSFTSGFAFSHQQANNILSREQFFDLSMRPGVHVLRFTSRYSEFKQAIPFVQPFARSEPLRFPRSATCDSDFRSHRIAKELALCTCANILAFPFTARPDRWRILIKHKRLPVEEEQVFWNPPDYPFSRGCLSRNAGLVPSENACEGDAWGDPKDDG